MHSLLSDSYLPALAGARRRLDTDPTLARILDPGADALVLERFLIEYCARGVRMTEPVESWIRRAGERCLQLGLPALGDSLISHARHEAGHHTMMIDDTRHLVGRWNSRHAQKLDADRLLEQPAAAATQRYIDLHEDTIKSDTPFGQIAIEYEIERISVVFAPKLVSHLCAKLGDDVMKGMSFLEEHVRLDIGHTHFNERLLGSCLAARPDSVAALARIGSEALEIYIDFFSQCFLLAEQSLERQAS